MIKTLRSLPTYLLLATGSLLLLNACTPTMAGPSVALKQQFAQLQQQQQQQAEQLNSLQKQLIQLQQQGLSAASVTPTSPEQALPVTKEERTTLKPAFIPAAISQEINALADSASSYLAAFSNLAAGRFAVAETGFASFLASYPQHQYSPNARYWLASAQLSQGKLPLAVSNLQQVISDSKGQDKAPAALILLAKTYQLQQRSAEAEDILEQLRTRYPESQEALQFIQTIDPQ